MTNEHIYVFPADDLGNPSVAHLPMDRRIEGNPAQSTWNFETTEDGTVEAGVWETEAGTWRSIRVDAWELCHIISGRSVLQDDGKPAVTVTAGDTFIIRPGFSGTWRAIETTRKVYVVKMGRQS